MYSNHVWKLVNLPERVKHIECKWVYKRKIGLDRKVETYTARLLSMGVTQKDKIDYEESFSPVVMIKSIPILLSILATLDYNIF